MGELMNGSTFPGRMISWAGAVCFGATTETEVIATCEVSVRNVLLALTRDRIPDARRAVVTISAIARITQRLYAGFFVPSSLDGLDTPAILFSASI
jgi:hypothetical protein